MDFASRSKSGTIAAIIVAVAGMFTIAGCDESLPPRLADPGTFDFRFKIQGGYCTVNEGVPQGGGTIEVDFVNSYSEVLRDSALVDLEVDVWLVGYPQARAHVSFGRSALADSSIVSGAILTVLPGISERFERQWSHRTAAGDPFYSFLPLEQITTKAGSYSQSPPVTIAMTGTVQLFKRVPPYTIPLTSATITYQVY